MMALLGGDGRTVAGLRRADSGREHTRQKPDEPRRWMISTGLQTWVATCSQGAPMVDQRTVLPDGAAIVHIRCRRGHSQAALAYLTETMARRGDRDASGGRVSRVCKRTIE